MNCDAIEELLLPYLDGALHGTEEESHIENHLRSCASCRAEYESLSVAFGRISIILKMSGNQITTPDIQWTDIEAYIRANSHLPEVAVKTAEAKARRSFSLSRERYSQLPRSSQGRLVSAAMIVVVLLLFVVLMGTLYLNKEQTPIYGTENTAQENHQWSAYFFDKTTNTLIRIDSSTQYEAFLLDIPIGYVVEGIRISSDGSQAAYCYGLPNDSTHQVLKYLAIRDIEQGINLIDMEIGYFTGCAVTAFQPDVLALALIYKWDPENGSGKRWALQLIDPLTGALLETVDNDHPDIRDIEISGTIITANVFELSRERVRFVIEGYVRSSFEWVVRAGTVTELPAPFGYRTSDFLPETGELVYTDYDETLPAVEPHMPISPYNVVKILDARGERIIYSNSEAIIYASQFINDGRSVLLSLTTNSTGEGFVTNYVIVNRNGTRTEINFDFRNRVFVESIPNGTLLAHTPTSDDFTISQTDVFILDSTFNLSAYPDLPELQSFTGNSPELIWASASPIASDLMPFVGQ